MSCLEAALSPRHTDNDLCPRWFSALGRLPIETVETVLYRDQEAFLFFTAGLVKGCSDASFYKEMCCTSLKTWRHHLPLQTFLQVASAASRRLHATYLLFSMVAKTIYDHFPCIELNLSDPARIQSRSPWYWLTWSAYLVRSSIDAWNDYMPRWLENLCCCDHQRNSRLPTTASLVLYFCHPEAMTVQTSGKCMVAFEVLPGFTRYNEW